MIYNYEMACKEAGLREDQTAEIRRFFDSEQKKLKRRNEAIDKNQIVYFSISQAVKELGENADYEIPDASIDVAEEVLHRMDLDRLREVMQELPEDDQEFLMVYFEEENFGDTRVAKRLGIPRQTVQYRKKKLLKVLRKKFFEKI